MGSRAREGPQPYLAAQHHPDPARGFGSRPPRRRRRSPDRAGAPAGPGSARGMRTTGPAPCLRAPAAGRSLRAPEAGSREAVSPACGCGAVGATGVTKRGQGRPGPRAPAGEGPGAGQRPRAPGQRHLREEAGPWHGPQAPLSSHRPPPPAGPRFCSWETSSARRVKFAFSCWPAARSSVRSGPVQPLQLAPPNPCAIAG